MKAPKAWSSFPVDIWLNCNAFFFFSEHFSLKNKNLPKWKTQVTMQQHNLKENQPKSFYKSLRFKTIQWQASMKFWWILLAP